jgi:hypothetical protein
MHSFGGNMAVFLLLGVAVPAHADDADLSAARSLLLKGRHAEAAARFAADAEINPAAAIGLARSHAAIGKQPEAQGARALHARPVFTR